MEGGEGFRGVIPFLERLQQKSYKAGNRFVVKRYQVPRPCGDCGGRRLRPEALQVTLGEKNIAELCALPVAEIASFFTALPLDDTQRAIAGAPLGEVQSRLRFLQRVDLGYHTLDRQARTLSGLAAATGFLQSRVARELKLRRTPRLTFEYDPSVENGVRMSQLIDANPPVLPEQSDDPDPD